jgi:hypothetical protein
LQWEKLVEEGRGLRFAAATGARFGVAVAYGVGFVLPLLAGLPPGFLVLSLLLALVFRRPLGVVV